MSYKIESWIGKNDVWYAVEVLDSPFESLPARGRGGTREEAIAEVEQRITERLAQRQKTAESRQTHKIEIIPEGAGVRVLEEEGDDDT